MQKLRYFATYANDTSEPPVGMIVRQVGYDAERRWRHHALYWNATTKQWIYDPFVGGFITNDENWDRFASIDRETAESVALTVTGGVVLPSEEQILEIFHSHES